MGGRPGLTVDDAEEVLEGRRTMDGGLPDIGDVRGSK